MRHETSFGVERPDMAAKVSGVVDSQTIQL